MIDTNKSGPLANKESRKLVILTEGFSEPVSGKTAVSVLRYRPQEVLALLDSTEAGKTADDVFQVGGNIPFVSNIDEVPDANTLMIGIAPPGGRMPEAWRRVVLAAIDRGMDVVSGLHQFLSDDKEFAEKADARGVSIYDVRKNHEKDVSSYADFRDECLRIHTVGHDCCIGKMVVAIELANAMKSRGTDAKFVATGQTGILIEGDGCPVDCVVSDFINGSAEKLVLANQHHEMLFIEGQGSLAHPRYSAVTLGLLHGTRPQGLILCYEVGREFVHGMEGVPLKSLAELRDVYEQMASLMHPCKVIGIAMNSRNVSAAEADAERERVRRELRLPVCDVIRHGSDELADAIELFRAVPAAS